MQDQPEQWKDLRPWQHGAIFLLACAILATRRPDAIFHPQFFAEDGHVWFADAYNLGWLTTLFRTQDGYFQTLPRLGAAVALHVPLIFAPLVLNLIALVVQALPVNLLLSSRSSTWGSLRYRSVLAAMYLALPNCREMIAIITSSQWVLVLCVFLLLAASTPRSIAARIFDFSLVILCGLTGPFCFFLLPVSLLFAWKRPDRWRWAASGLLAALCLVQAYGLLVVNPSGRAHAILGASPALLTRILSSQIFLGALLGGNGLAVNLSTKLFIFLLCVAMGGMAIFVYCFAKSTFNMKVLLLLSSMLLVASFLSPAAYPPPGVSRWQMLASASGIRYWFFPTLAFAWSIVLCFQSRSGALRILSGVLLCVMCFGIVRDWRIPPLKDLHFAEDAMRFEAAPAGTTLTIPGNPEGWNMRLVKHAH